MTTRVFETLRIGPVELPNRLALAPVKTAFGDTDGMVTQRHIEYYRRRAQGGAGLLTIAWRGPREVVRWGRGEPTIPEPADV